MSDNLQESLQLHKAQLLQVESSLINDPDNESLLQLKQDLQKIVELTEELLDDKSKKTEVAQPTLFSLPDNFSVPFSTSFPVVAKCASSRKSRLQTKEDYAQRAEKNEQRKQREEKQQETMKTSWQQFNSKVIKKKKHGLVKKSIFATSDLANAKVGVGTCGVSGKPMTGYKYVKHAPKLVSSEILQTVEHCFHTVFKLLFVRGK